MLQFTARSLLDPSCEAESVRLDSICRVFSIMVRSAYNASLEGNCYVCAKRMLKRRYFIKNARWRQWAIDEARAKIEAQKEIIPLYVKDLSWKIERVKNKMARTANPLKRAGYEARVRKLGSKKWFYEKHIRNKTIPRIVFGSKQLLRKLAKSSGEEKIELLEQWRRKRNGQFCSVGQANQGGNANTRIKKEQDGFLLEIRNWPPEDFTVRLRVPDVYTPIFQAAADGLISCYTVRVVKRINGRFDCFVTFEINESPIVSRASRKIGSIDVNPTRLDSVILSHDGNLLTAKTFEESALIYARKEKRLWLASNLVEKALRWIRSYGVNTLVIEGLELNSRVEYRKHVNRIIANFMQKKLIELIKMKALKRDWILCEEEPAWTSTIAEAKYKKQFPRISIHQLAAYVLGRRALGFGENLSTQDLEAIPQRKRQYAQAYTWSFYGHRHPYLKPHISTDGRMGVEDAKGRDAFDKWVTPCPCPLGRAVRLSVLLTGGCRADEARARGHRVNPPSSYQPDVNRLSGAMLASNASIVNV